MLDEQEIKKKIEEYKTSDASIEVKEQAIKKLIAKLASKDGNAVAKQQYMEAQPDMIGLLDVE